MPFLESVIVERRDKNQIMQKTKNAIQKSPHDVFGYFEIYYSTKSEY